MYEIKICRGPECGRPGNAGKGLCRTHYAQNRKGKPLTPIRRQKSDDQILEETVQQLTQRATKNPKPMCIGPECVRVAATRGMCKAHYQQQYAGNPLTPIRPQANRQDVNSEIRLCNTCHRKKPRSEFHMRMNGNPQTECKFCASKRSRLNYLISAGRQDEADALRASWEGYKSLENIVTGNPVEEIKWAAVGHDYEVEQ